MFKKLFTLCNLLFLTCTTVGVSTLTSCSSGGSEETNDIAGVMTLADFASGRERFFIRNAYFRFFFINSDGTGAIAPPSASNEVILRGSIEVDGVLYPVNMIYKTNETFRPDGIPTEATLEMSLVNPSDATSVDLITAVFRDIGNGSGNPEIKGEPMVLSMDFGSGLGSLQCTIETDFTYTTDDGNIIIGRDTSEESQNIALSVISSTIGPE